MTRLSHRSPLGCLALLALVAGCRESVTVPAADGGSDAPPSTDGGLPRLDGGSDAPIPTDAALDAPALPSCEAASCSDHGACDDTSGLIVCTCDVGYAGDACETCDAGYQDADGDGECMPACETATCSGHGACDDTSGVATCTCSGGYVGADCGACGADLQDHDGDGVCAPVCEAATCSGHGTCSDASGMTVCTCTGGYTGTDCSGCAAGEQDRDGDGTCAPACTVGTCTGHGVCDDASGIATCACDTGHTAADCASCASGYQDNDGDGACTLACTASTCGPHGACSDASGTTACTCDLGYAGVVCASCASGYQDNDGDGTCAPTCTASTCSGHGTCSDTSGTASCTCATGYAGPSCASCATGYQDNDGNGTCSAACAIAGCPGACDDTTGTRAATARPPAPVTATVRAAPARRSGRTSPARRPTTRSRPASRRPAASSRSTPRAPRPA